MPDALRSRIFEKLFLKAEIAKLSKKARKEYDQSLKKLRDMNVVIADRDRKIADRDQKIVVLSKDIVILSKENVAQAKEIARLKKQLGLNA